MLQNRIISDPQTDRPNKHIILNLQSPISNLQSPISILHSALSPYHCASDTRSPFSFWSLQPLCSARSSTNGSR